MSEAPYGAPVETLAELDTLDDGDILEGYRDGRAGEPPPMGNRSKGYWHGWRNGSMDAGLIPIDPEARRLAAAYLARMRSLSPTPGAS